MGTDKRCVQGHGDERQKGACAMTVRWKTIDGVGDGSEVAGAVGGMVIPARWEVL